jgi:hypothetical protein
MKYTHRNDGEGFSVPSGAVYRLACCDCGLVHDMVFVSADGKPIGVAAKRNNRATAGRRRKKHAAIVQRQSTASRAAHSRSQ